MDCYCESHNLYSDQHSVIELNDQTYLTQQRKPIRTFSLSNLSQNMQQQLVNANEMSKMYYP